MEPGRESAPPVVAVMVVHLPDPVVPSWFDEVLAGLAQQDYANLRTLFLLVGETGDVPERIRRSVPQAFVRAVQGNPGFGAVADEVLHLVEGDNGFFCFLHDDVALDPDAIRLLVEELYRSNAGIVGPKLVEWSDPSRLQHVGFGVDRFGETDPIVEHGEVDQEQHDAVRDVFALPSACLLVRADLFRSLGGFDPAISFHGEDLDLCWRAHRSGARVVVVPSARARHRERLLERRPDLPHETLRARHRMRSVATLSGGRRLPLLSLELTLLTLAELVIGCFTGNARRGVAGVRALVGLVPRTFSIVARRRALAPQRQVPDREVIGLQVRGSARFAAYLRSRDARPDAFDVEARSWRQRAGAAGVITWITLVAVVVIASRELIADGVPAFGQFLPFPGARTMLRGALSGWWPHAAGGAVASPTGYALIAVASVGTLFNMGLLHTLGVIGLLLLGPLGIWRLTASFATNRSRIAALAVYAAVPLPAQMISMGRWSALVAYAATPWFVDGLRRSAGLTGAAGADDREVVVALPRRSQLQLLAGTSLVVALGVAFAPGFVIVAPLLVVVLAAATLVVGAPVTAARILGAGLVAVLVGVLLDLPWTGSLLGEGGWTAVIGASRVTGSGDGEHRALELLSFDLGHVPASVLALALFVPVLAAPLLGRGWRFAWATRAAFMAVAFGWLAVLDDAGRLPVRLPEPGIVLAPVAVGLAVAAGCVVAAFELDVRGGSFGWRQPLGVLATVAIVVGVLPGIASVTSGRYETPRTTMSDLLGFLPQHPGEGDYRVLWLGDARLLPAAGRPYRGGVGYALTDDRALRVDEVWGTRPTSIDADLVTALDAIADGSTARAGRLLAPLAIRYVIIPVIDGAVSTNDDIQPVPLGLQDALADQLDLGQQSGPPNFIVYQNRAWIPTRSMLTPSGAEASREAGAAAIARADLSGATGVMVAQDHLRAATADIPAGTLHVAVPFDRRWVLEVDGERVPGRPAFGATLAFDVPEGGTAVLRYDQPGSRQLQLAAQALGWSLVLLVALGVRMPRRHGGRRRASLAGTGPVLQMDGTVDESTDELGSGDPADFDGAGDAARVLDPVLMRRSASDAHDGDALDPGGAPDAAPSADELRHVLQETAAPADSMTADREAER